MGRRQTWVREGNDVIIGTIEEDGFESSPWINFEEKKLERGEKETEKGSLSRTQQDIGSGWEASYNSLISGTSGPLSKSQIFRNLRFLDWTNKTQ